MGRWALGDGCWGPGRGGETGSGKAPQLGTLWITLSAHVALAEEAVARPARNRGGRARGVLGLVTGSRFCVVVRRRAGILDGRPVLRVIADRLVAVPVVTHRLVAARHVAARHVEANLSSGRAARVRDDRRLGR